MGASDDELAARTRAVLDAAAGYVFGTEPGRLAAELYDVLVRTTDDRDRARVAAALARCWAYGGYAARAAEFADQAVERAERTGDPELVADCLDATLAAHWGPDELDVRTGVGARLEEIAAHVLDPTARLHAHRWALQIACEALDVQSIHRQLRALDQLGEESPKARFFAVSRRWMYDMLRGRTDRAPARIAAATAAAEEADLADAWMVLYAMRGYTALYTGDEETCARLAGEMEEFGRDEGIPVVTAEAAWVWTGAGRPDRVRTLLGELGGTALDRLPRDVNWLLTLQCVLEAALYVHDRESVAVAHRLLAPYEGRAVFNAGAVNFHGVTDDTLARAAALLGDTAKAHRLRDRALAAYLRIGAPWWHDRLAAWRPSEAPAPDARRRFRLHPTTGGVWLVGADPGRPLRPVRGLTYLHRLIERPGSAVSAIELMTDGRETYVQPDVDTVIDRRAAAAYRARLAEIDDELAEARQWADLGRVEQLTKERAALLAELGAAAGPGHRLRGTGSTRERARVAATKAINVAVERIAGVDAELGRHLEDAVHTGTECGYHPAPGTEVDWVLTDDAEPGSRGGA